MFELYLPQQIEELICYIDAPKRKICNVEIYDPMCHSKNSESKAQKTVWKFRMRPISNIQSSYKESEENKADVSLNFQLDIIDLSHVMTSSGNKTSCGPFCQLKIYLKVAEILRESFTLAIAHEVSSPEGASYVPDVKTVNMKMIIACDGGFKLIQGLCMACPLNTYSEEGSTECESCPYGTYQPNIGARSCEKCPNPFKKGCAIMWMTPGVIAVTTFIVLVFIGLSVLCFYGFKIIIWRKIFRRVKGKKKKDSKSKVESKNVKKKKKDQSPVRRKKHEDTSEPPSPPTEDFTSG